LIFKIIIFVFMSIRAKIFIVRLQLFTLIILSAAASAQTKGEIKEMFLMAESYYLYGDYELANPIYLSLASFYPDNNNLNYKIGNCYLNIPDEKSKSISFLEKAVKNCSYDAKPDRLKENRAPLDAYFSLGRAYMINNELDKAINTFKIFQNLVTEAKGKQTIENIDYVDQQILACQNAMKFEGSAVEINKVKLPPGFSQGSVNDDPVVSFDGNTLAYTERRGISNAIFYSTKERGKWQDPIEITYELNAGDDCSTSCLNNDGTELFLYKEDMEDGNIYSSTFSNGKWSPVKKLNNNINTKFYESHAAISADGKKLYFTSNRAKGTDLDIYVSEKDPSTNDWGVAVNLGKVINTSYNEDTPFILKSDSILYFSSEGHTSMGGYDIFKSSRRNGTWSEPENIGYPINTTDDDKFFEPVDDGLNAYYSMPTDYKKKEIFFLGIGVSANELLFRISGTLSLNDSIEKPDENDKVFLLDYKTGDTLNFASVAKTSGNYRLRVNQGNYRLIFTGPDYVPRIIDTLLTRNNPDSLITLNVMLDKKEYENIDLTQIPEVSNVDSSILVTNMRVNDLADREINDADVLYYTVQVMALHNPVDVRFFKYIDDIQVMYNDKDQFFRYTTGHFATRQEAIAWMRELIKRGYPNDLFVKKVSH
jgi:tetratricopeptide (TPR) repeat protein